MDKKVYWYQRLSRWTVIIGLGLTGLAHASDDSISKEELEKQFVDKALADQDVVDLQNFSSHATRFYEPLAKVEKELQELPKEVLLDKEAFAGRAFKLWLETRFHAVSHPLLQAVCMNYQRRDDPTLQKPLDYLKDISDRLLFAAKSYPAESRENLKMLMMAAYEVIAVDQIVGSDFDWPTDPKQMQAISSLMYLPVKLWRQSANHPYVMRASARDLWELIPRIKHVHRAEEADCCCCVLDAIRNKLKLPAYYDGEPLDEDDHADEAWNAERASRAIMVPLFRAYALRRATNYAGWHLRSALRLTRKVEDQIVRMVPYMGSQEIELEARFAISKDISQCIADVVPAIGCPFVKTQAAHMAAELRAWPHRSLRTGLSGKPVDETILSEGSAKIFKRELSYAVPFLQEMQEAVIEHSKDLDLEWGSRLMVVRAYYGLAMLASDNAIKRTLLEQALELSKLREGEHDPARYMHLPGDDTGNYRYNHGDLYQGLEFPTWENAITLRLKELDEKQKK